VGFDKCAIDVVRCYRLDGLLLRGRVQGASPSFKTSFGDTLERAVFEGRVTLIHLALPSFIVRAEGFKCPRHRCYDVDALEV